MEFNENFILGCSAIGAGLAVIAGIGHWCRSGYRSWSCCCCSWQKPGCKIRYHLDHAAWSGGCRDNRSVWSADCDAAAVCKTSASLIREYFKKEGGGKSA